MNCQGVEDDRAAVAGHQEVVVVEQQPEEEEEEDDEQEEEMVEAQTAVVSVVEAGSQEVLHQVHFTMEVDGTTQEQQVRGGRVHIWPKALQNTCSLTVFFSTIFAMIKKKVRHKDLILSYELLPWLVALPLARWW